MGMKPRKRPINNKHASDKTEPFSHTDMREL
jgi:hypothetical protein